MLAPVLSDKHDYSNKQLVSWAGYHNIQEKVLEPWYLIEKKTILNGLLDLSLGNR